MHRWMLVCGVLAGVVLAGCGREEHTLVAAGVLNEERSGGASALGLEGRLHEGSSATREFRQMWDAVTNAAAPFEGMAITLSGGGDRDEAGVSRLAGVVLVTPLPLVRGARYSVGRALPPPAVTGMPMYWSSWGGRNLPDGQAQIAYRSFDYHSVGMISENEFVATAASGTIEVVERHRGDQVVLRVDIILTAADSRVVRLRGDIRVTAERYTPPFS